MIDARVVFLTHYIPLYQVRVLQSIARRVRDFHVLVSTPIEPNRDFAPDWSGLDVTVQDTWTVRRQWRHRGEGQFADSLYIHVPYDTGRQLRRLRPDVVMSLELGARSVGAARYCRRNRESKLILCTYMSQRTEQCRGRMRRWVRRRLVRSADAITYNGPSCLGYLQSLGVDEDRTFHLPYAADDRTLYRGSLQRDESAVRQRLVVVGQLSSRKGVVPLVEQTAAYLRRQPTRNVELVFAGDGPDRGAIEAIETPDNLSLTLLGNVPAAELGDLLHGCGAMIAPTLADEWMLVVNEGLQAGLPIIGSIYSQAVTTLVQDGHNGWRYDPVDQTQFDRAMEAYFSMPDDRLSAMREVCRQSVSQRSPSWAASGAIDAIGYVTGQSTESQSTKSQPAERQSAQTGSVVPPPAAGNTPSSSTPPSTPSSINGSTGGVYQNSMEPTVAPNARRGQSAH